MTLRRIGAIICGVVSATDPCKRLCDFDGPAVCTDGSYTKKGNVCDKYLFRGDPKNLDYCYHTKRSRDVCPSNGVPVTTDDVDRLISGRRGLTTPNPNDISGLIERVEDLGIDARARKRVRGDWTTTTEPSMGFESDLMRTLAELPMYSAYESMDTLIIEIIVKIVDPKGYADVYVAVKIGEDYEVGKTVDCFGEKFRISEEGEIVFDEESRCSHSYIEKVSEAGGIEVQEIPLRFKVPDRGETHLVLSNIYGKELRLDRVQTTPRPKKPVHEDVWGVLEWDLLHGDSHTVILERVELLEYVSRHPVVVSESAIESWRAMKGHLLVEYAKRTVDIDCDDESLPFSFEGAVFAALYIAQELITGDVDRDAFLADSGISELCSLHGSKIKQFINEKHYYEWSSRFGVAALVPVYSYLKHIERLCPELRDDLQMKAIAFAHKLYAFYTPDSDEPLFAPEVSNFAAKESIIFLLRANPLQMARGLRLKDRARRLRKLELWFTRMARFFSDPRNGLLSPPTNEGMMWITPRDATDRARLMVYEALGKFLALSVIENIPVGIRFPGMLWTRLIGNRQLELADIKDELPLHYAFLSGIMEAKTDEELSALIELNRAHLKGELPTMANRNEFVKNGLRAIPPATRPQFLALQKGFLSSFPPGLLDIFSGPELRDLVSGARNIQVEDVITHLDVAEDQQHLVQIRWLYNVLRSFSQVQLRAFIEALTGSPQIPIQGMAGFPTQISVFLLENPRVPPGIHQISSSLVLPRSESEEALRAELMTYMSTR
jgi:hypothetical protein